MSRRATRPSPRAARSSPTPRFSAKRSCSATPPRPTSCFSARFAAPSKPRATTPSRTSSSSTCSTSSSARRSASTRSRPPSPGAATPTSSTTTPDIAALSCPTRRTRRLPPARTASEDRTHACPPAGRRSHLAVSHRFDRHPLRPHLLLRDDPVGNLLDGAADAGGRHLSLRPRAAALRLLLRRAHCHRLPVQPHLLRLLRLCRRL